MIKFIFDLFKLFFSPLVKLLNRFYQLLPYKLEKRKPELKLGIIGDSRRDHTWNYGQQNNKKVIFINTYWILTNTLPYHLTAVNSFLVKPEQSRGGILIKNVNDNIWGHYTIPKGYTTEVEISFIINKNHIKKSDNIITAEIELEDPIGKRHKISNIKIYPFKGNINKKISVIIEDQSRVHNKTEKQVVSVLKNEIQQYKVRGRREGRLGTVEWPRGSIEWTIEGGKIQFLSENSDKNNVRSEHITALMNLYNSSSESEKKIIIDSLLKRINKQNEYRDVGYLIIFFFFEIDLLEESLKVFLKKLHGDKANGFSDGLKMLDILLAFRSDEFVDSELDAIERFTYQTKEHPFRIKERINAIRIKKLL